MFSAFIICCLLGICATYRLQPKEAARLPVWVPAEQGFLTVALQDLTTWVRSADAAGSIRCCCEGSRWGWNNDAKNTRCHVYVVTASMKKCGDFRKPRWAKGSMHHYTYGGICLIATTEVQKVQAVLQNPSRASREEERQITIPNSNVELQDVTQLVRQKDAEGSLRCCCDSSGGVISDWNPQRLVEVMSANRTNRCQIHGINGRPNDRSAKDWKCGDYAVPDWATSSMHHYTRTGGACLIGVFEVVQLVTYLGTAPDYCWGQSGVPSMPLARLGELVKPMNCPENTIGKPVYCTYVSRNRGIFRPQPKCKPQVNVHFAPKVLPIDQQGSQVAKLASVFGPVVKRQRTKERGAGRGLPRSASLPGARKLRHNRPHAIANPTPVIGGNQSFRQHIARHSPFNFDINGARTPVIRQQPMIRPNNHLGRKIPTTTLTTTSTVTTAIAISTTTTSTSRKRPVYLVRDWTTSTVTTITTTITITTSTSESVQQVISDERVVPVQNVLDFPTREEYDEFLDVKTFGQDLHKIVRIGKKVAANLFNPRWAKSMTGSFRVTKFLHRERESSLLLKMQKPYYSSRPLKGMVVGIVGAGPAGLRLAVEARLMGADVHVIEARDRFIRYNVMKLWAYTVEDMVSIGIKDLYPELVSKTARRIPIATLQEALSRVALAVGANFHVACKFHRLRRYDQGDVFMEVDDTCKNRQIVQKLRFNAIFDATGTRAVLRDNRWGENPFIDSKEAGGSDAIGMTINFKRFGSKGEREYTERTKQDPRFKKYNPALTDKSDLSKQFARDLFNEKAVDIENWVYWQSDLSHYLVLTINMNSLIEQDVLQGRNGSSTEQLLRKCDKDKLAEMSLKIAEEWNVPHMSNDKDAFIENSHGEPDISIFEFGGARKSVNAAVELPGPQGSPPVIFGVVGDAMCTPFWPQGTGANRAHYSAHLQTMTLMAAWQGDQNYEAACALADEMMGRLLAMPITGNEPNYDTAAYEATIQKNYNGISSGSIPSFY